MSPVSFGGPGHPSGRREEAGVPPALRGLVSLALRVGVVLAAFLLGIGLLLAYHDGGAPGSAPSRFSASTFVHTVVAGGPSALLLLGLLALIATPLARVVISVGLFASRGDRPFTLLTLFVLTVLVVSIGAGVRP